MRLSDLHLRTKESAPKTWLDDFEFHVTKLQEQENKFNEEEARIREESTERGRAQVPNMVLKSMHKDLVKLNYDPYDIKSILHPIDFLVFNGMNKDEMKDIVLLAKQTLNPYLQEIHKKIAAVIENKSYDWKVMRVTHEGEVKIE
jgi:predicted Holliday junction resolvase-like endonuclease